MAPEFSSTVAQHPQLVPTPFQRPDGSPLYYSRGHPPNKFGFRYQPCGPSSAGGPQQAIYKLIQDPPTDVVRFSWEDRSPYVLISEDAKTVSSDKGFRSARANLPIRDGTWYFEVLIERGGGEPGQSDSLDGAHVRLGVGRRESSLNAPVGMDAYSYGLRDKTGDKVSISQPQSYGQSFTSGDVIGVLVHIPERSLPEDPNADPLDPRAIHRKRIPIQYKRQLYFESLEYIPSREMTRLVDAASEASLPKQKQVKQKAAAPGMKHRPLPSENAPPLRPLPILPGSSIHFFKNGQPMSTEPAFTDLFDYVPLRRHPPPEDKSNKSSSKKNKKKEQDALNPMNDRENFNDDGTLGYYPVVSCYGGGIARLNPGPQLLQQPDLSALDPALANYGVLSDLYPLYFAQLQEDDMMEEQQILARIQMEEEVARQQHQLEGSEEQQPLPHPPHAAAAAMEHPVDVKLEVEPDSVWPGLSHDLGPEPPHFEHDTDMS